MSAAADGVSRETRGGGEGPRRRAGVADRTAARRVGGRVAAVGTWLALAPIRGYRRFISPLLGPRCRYYPTCSAYAEQAVRELGPIRGLIVASWRVLRCNPLSAGGLDPLENRRLFRRAPHPHAPSSPGAHVR